MRAKSTSPSNISRANAIISAPIRKYISSISSILVTFKLSLRLVVFEAALLEVTAVVLVYSYEFQLVLVAEIRALMVVIFGIVLLVVVVGHQGYSLVHHQAHTFAHTSYVARQRTHIRSDNRISCFGQLLRQYLMPPKYTSSVPKLQLQTLFAHTEFRCCSAVCVTHAQLNTK